MAHYVASINMFEQRDGSVRISIRVFRVYDFGARPQRPVWSDYVTVEAPTAYNPKEWLAEVLGGRIPPLDE